MKRAEEMAKDTCLHCAYNRKNGCAAEKCQAMLMVEKQEGMRLWLNEKLNLPETVECLQSVETIDQVKGKIIIGTVPLELAAFAREVWAVSMELTPAQKGKNLTTEEMDKAGARLKRFKVVNLD